jgi:hypothetical protein
MEVHGMGYSFFGNGFDPGLVCSMGNMEVQFTWGGSLILS